LSHVSDTYGRVAPAGIPQHIWDAAIDEWLEDSSTVDKRRIMTIAQRMIREEPDVLKRWWPDAVETVAE
jgi:hypothetical protein